MECHGCHASGARYCAACVQQAVAEKQKLLRERNAANVRLERAMSVGLQQRQNILRQQEARSVHGQQLQALRNELAVVRREVDAHARVVNELRHDIRRSRQRLNQLSQHSLVRTPPEGLGTEHRANLADAEKSVKMRLSEARRTLLKRLLQIMDMQWLSSAPDGQHDTTPYGGDIHIADVGKKLVSHEHGCAEGIEGAFEDSVRCSVLGAAPLRVDLRAQHACASETDSTAASLGYAARSPAPRSTLSRAFLHHLP
eukprot:4608134-Pleurochrysis_carterae.AAC.3